MKSGIAKRSIVIGSHKTSFSLEDPFWIALKDLATKSGRSLKRLVEKIDDERNKSEKPPNLSSAIRVYVLEAYMPQHKAPAVPAGERKALLAEA